MTHNIEEVICTDVATYFQYHCGILLQDSPQLLDDYIYIEFEDANGNDVKCRIPYPHNDKYNFVMNTSATEQVLYVLQNVVKQQFRPAF